MLLLFVLAALTSGTTQGQLSPRMPAVPQDSHPPTDQLTSWWPLRIWGFGAQFLNAAVGSVDHHQS